MRRLTLAAIFIVMAGLMTGRTAEATTYYVAATGADSNSGTSKATPWLHAPGMTGCTGACAAANPGAGDSIILRGGDAWHYSVGTPIGLPWTFNWSGTSTNCNLDAMTGTIVKTSCIYIGVDPTWYTGGAFTRPKLTMDNPLSTSRPAGCTYDDTNNTGINANGNDLILDNIEFLGDCWNGDSNNGWIQDGGNNHEYTNLYYHGWTFGNSSQTDQYPLLINGGNYTLVDHCVFDGSDASLGTTAGEASGMVLYNAATEIAFNVFNRVSNGQIGFPKSVHDNLFENMYEPQGSVHGNVIETNSPQQSLGNLYFYNNVIHDTNEGVTVWLEPYNGFSEYYFNNVVFNIGNGGNCLMIDGQGSTPASNLYITNNTIDSSCNIRFFGGHAGQQFVGAGIFENNDFIGFSPASLSSVYSIDSGASATVTDNGHHIFQTTSAANAQGYSVTNGYAPTSSNGATIGAGAILTSSCSTFSDNLALCSGTSGSVTENSGNGGFEVNSPAISLVTRLSGWDAGAYEFSSGSASLPNPPTNLTAVIE